MTRYTVESRVRHVLSMLNSAGKVTVDDLFQQWKVDPHYIRRLLRMIADAYGLDFDGDVLKRVVDLGQDKS